jgi:hypothetical protein
MAGGRIGRVTSRRRNSGRRRRARRRAQSAQKVHSNVQIIASALSAAGRGRSIRSWA